jgi:hypothetical protein
VMIALDAANAITLKGIALSALHADEFVFA